MKIKNSQTGSLIEIVDSPVSIYNCGPTVYNDVHIGNLRPILTLDVLHRYLLMTKIKVNYFHNITDIDDKIINKSKQEKTTEKKIAQKYTSAYKVVLKKLGIIPVKMPKVSHNIQNIIEFISKLIDKKAAYVSRGDVYFNVNKIKQYGELSHQDIEKLIDGNRKENSKNKKNPLDFVLWKKTTTGKRWKSPWSKGRPGWHTECVCMINKYIGTQVTIHGGGVDLKFPHHENENAQNIALNNLPLASVWMHVGHITINSEKMSKSVGNFVLAKDLLNEFSPNVVKWFFYQTQYQNPLNFSKEILLLAKSDLEKIRKSINNALNQMYLNNFKFSWDSKKIPNEIIVQIEDDLNFPNVVSYIWENSKSLATLISKKKYAESQIALRNLKKSFEILGIEFNFKINFSKKILLRKWQKLVAEKDFTKADILREKIEK